MANPQIGFFYGGALTVAGVAAWIYQLIGGLGVTGMNNGTSWGLYITCFMFFVGLSAGGLGSAASTAGWGALQACHYRTSAPMVVRSVSGSALRAGRWACCLAMGGPGASAQNIRRMRRFSNARSVI